MAKTPLTLVLANPRGFCAGVERAIEIVERAIAKYGPPVYVRHEIVHNRFVVESLKAKGAIFVDELDAVADDRPVIFSAHGVPKRVPAEAQRRELFFLDATCPLVSKVHREAERHHRQEREILLIGHRGHPEVIGTMGQLPEGAIRLIETAEEAETVEVKDPERLAYVTQTTLSVDDTAAIVTVLERRFPAIVGPAKQDICYATTNRQEAVKRIAEEAEVVLVVGAPNSSNSKRLVEVAQRAGCRHAALVERASDIPWEAIGDARRVGLTAGASAPETLVEEVIDAFRARYDVTLIDGAGPREDIHFKLPRPLLDTDAA